MTVNTQELLDQLQTAHATRIKEGETEKLTPTQKKHLFIEELSQGMIAQDPEAVKGTLENFKIAIPNAAVRTILLQNFNQEIADLLVERGLKVEGRFYTLGQECKTPEAMRFLLQTSSWENENKFNQKHYDKLTDEYQKNHYLLYCAPFDPEIIPIYQQNIVSNSKATSKERANHAGIRKAILEKFPNLPNLMLKGGNSWFLNNCLEDYKNMKEDLKTLKKENLPVLVTSISGYNRFTTQQLFNFFKILKDFNLEEVFQDHVSSIEHKRLQACLIQQEWLVGETFFDTNLYKEASQIKVNLGHSGFYYQGLNTTPKTLADWVEQGIGQPHLQGSFEEKIMSILLHNGRHLHGIKEKFNQLFDLDILLNAQELTPWEALLGNNNVIGILSQTTIGKKIIENNLSSLGKNQFASLNVSSFKEVMDQMPSLYEWRDDNGNSLMHLVASNNSSKQAAETFIRMSRDLMTEPNKEGLSPLDLMLQAGLKENIYASLQKSLMKKTLRSSDSEGGVKARARKKHSSGPRRM